LRPPSGPALALALVLVAGGCLPASIRPTPTPGPPGTATPSPSPTDTPTPGPPTPAPAPTFLVYTVVRGDALVALATRFHTTGRSIAYWSRDLHPSLDPESATYDPGRIEIGWVLRVIPDQEYREPMGPGESPDPTPSPTPTPTSAAGSSSALSSGPGPTASG
jgi:hypothetical protein